MKISIGDTAYEVDDKVGGYVISLKKSLADTQKKLETQKATIEKEIKEKLEKDNLVATLKDSGFELDGKETLDYLKGLALGAKTHKKAQEPNYGNINFDDIIIDV